MIHREPSTHKTDCKLVRTRIFQQAVKCLFHGLHPTRTYEHREARAIMMHFDCAHIYVNEPYQEALEDVPESAVPLVCMPFLLANPMPDENANRRLYALHSIGAKWLEEFWILIQTLSDAGEDASFDDILPEAKTNLGVLTKQFIKAALEFPFHDEGEDTYDMFRFELPYTCIVHQIAAWKGHPVPLERRLQFMAYYYAFYNRVFDAAEQALVICELGNQRIYTDELTQLRYLLAL